MDQNNYRLNELYRRFRSMCYELAGQSIDKVDAKFENRIVTHFARVQQEFKSETNDVSTATITDIDRTHPDRSVERTLNESEVS